MTSPYFCICQEHAINQLFYHMLLENTKLQLYFELLFLIPRIIPAGGIIKIYYSIQTMEAIPVDFLSLLFPFIFSVVLIVLLSVYF
jgi:hypothetical protein